MYSIMHLNVVSKCYFWSTKFCLSRCKSNYEVSDIYRFGPPLSVSSEGRHNWGYFDPFQQSHGHSPSCEPNPWVMQVTMLTTKAGLGPIMIIFSICYSFGSYVSQWASWNVQRRRFEVIFLQGLDCSLILNLSNYFPFINT